MPGGTYTVTVHYAGDGTFGASDSTPGISVTVTPESTTRVTLTAPVLNFNNGNIAQTLATPSGGRVDFGDVVYLRADIKGVANQGNATGMVTFTDDNHDGNRKRWELLVSIPKGMPNSRRGRISLARR